jgi:hypothetical protein
VDEANIMTEKYTVSCYSPPKDFTLAEKDEIEVQGWRTRKKIRANYIITLKDKKRYNFEQPTPPEPKSIFPGIADPINKTGTVSNIQKFETSNAIQFDLEPTSKNKTTPQK